MSFPSRIGFDEARRIIDEVAARRRMPAEHVSLAKAHGRVLAQSLAAMLPQPGFDNSAMDGFALRHADLGADGGTAV